MNEPERQIMTILGEAVEYRSPEERAAFLDRACAGDADRRTRVEALLRAYEAAGNFLQGDPAPREPAATVDEAAREQSGTVIGPYKLLQVIGEGGMGTVFMAEQAQPVRRKVALKVIKPGMDSRQVIARFEAERQALAMMDHVNIARVFDGGATENGRPYFVMELVHGVPITKYCDDNHLTPRERLELFVPVCQAIQHAHQKGIIHRDVKPSNVMVTLYDGKAVPKVIDFGVAKATEQKLTERTLFTQYGTMVGTLEYMSPEQAEMSALGVDTRSDIYSLGVLLYELLTGSTPLTHKRMKEAAYAEILRMIKEEEPPRPSTRLSDSGGALASISAQRHMEPAKLTKLMRGELDWIVMKTLEKDRSRRYETANGFAADVQRYLNDETVQACPPSKWYRFRKFARRNRIALTTATLVAATLVVGMVVSTWQAIRATRAEGLADTRLQAESMARNDAEKARKDEAEQRTIADQRRIDADKQRQIADEQRNLAKERERTARWQAYTAHINLANQNLEMGRVGPALGLLERHLPQSDQEDLRGFEWYYLWRLCHSGHRFSLRSNKGAVRAVAYSSAGNTLASGNADGTVTLWALDTRKIQRTFEGHSGLIRSVAFSPDGKILASGSSDGTVKLWHVATGEEQTTLRGHKAPVSTVTFSPDGRTIASGSRDNTARLWDVGTGKERQTLRGHSNPDNYIHSLAFSPDGMLLACGGGSLNNAMVWDLATGKERFSLNADPFDVRSVAFSRDGKTLATGDSDMTVRLWDVAAGKVRRTFDGPNQVSSVAFSEDGKVLASGFLDGTIKLWDPDTARERSTLQGHRQPVSSIAFSPDGKSLASASSDGIVKLWDIAAEQPPSMFPGTGGIIWSMAISPDGKKIASTHGGNAADPDDSVKLWDVSTGKVEATLSKRPGGILSVAFSPDGKVLATGSWDLKLWDVVTGKDLADLEHYKVVWSVAFSGDGRTLAFGGHDNIVRIWDVATRKERATLKSHTGHVRSVSFAPHGKTLASSGNDSTVKVWDVATEQLIFTLRGHTGQVFAVAFSPDGNTLASGAYDGVRLWDARTGRQLAVLRGNTNATAVRTVAFSPDGKTLAAGHDEVLTLWDVASGQERATFRGHTRGIMSLAFSPDGRTLATASLDAIPFNST